MNASTFSTSEALSRKPLKTCERWPDVTPHRSAKSPCVVPANPSAARNRLRSVAGPDTVRREDLPVTFMRVRVPADGYPRKTTRN